MIQYTQKTDALGNHYIEGIDGDTLRIIPINSENSDYQAYLESLNEAKTK